METEDPLVTELFNDLQVLRQIGPKGAINEAAIDLKEAVS